MRRLDGDLGRAGWGRAPSQALSGKKAEFGAKICYFDTELIKAQLFSREFLQPNWICFPCSRALLVWLFMENICLRPGSSLSWEFRENLGDFLWEKHQNIGGDSGAARSPRQGREKPKFHGKKMEFSWLPAGSRSGSGWKGEPQIPGAPQIRDLPPGTAAASRAG